MPNLTLQTIVVVMLGSGLGGGARLWVSTLVSRVSGTTFPWGTLVVNIAGCVVVGALGALLAPPGRLHDAQQVRVFLVTGKVPEERVRAVHRALEGAVYRAWAAEETLPLDLLPPIPFRHAWGLWVSVLSRSR